MVIIVADIVLHKQESVSNLESTSNWDVLSHEVVIIEAIGSMTKLMRDEDLHAQHTKESQLIKVYSHERTHTCTFVIEAPLPYSCRGLSVLYLS